MRNLDYGNMGPDMTKSGRLFEYELVDKVDVNNPDYRKALAQIAGKDGYVSREKSIALAKKFQPGDPANPGRDFLRELLIAVQDELGLTGGNTPETSALAYTAVGTPLDIYHGVDAFLAVTKAGREVIVTLDITGQEEKMLEGGKADLIVGSNLPLPEDDEGAYLATVDGYAKKVVEVVRQQEEQRSSQNQGRPNRPNGPEDRNRIRVFRRE